LYKQATIGPCNTQQPAFYEVVSRAKWYFLFLKKKNKKLINQKSISIIVIDII